MTEVENQPSQPPALSQDVFDPDDVGPRDTPPLRAMKVNLTPSPSPPPVAPLPQDSSDSSSGSPGRKGSNRHKIRPSHGDAVLVSFMGDGKRSEIARQAAAQPLASDDEEEEESVKGTEVNVNVEKDKDRVDELTALAQNALRAHEGQTAQSSSQAVLAASTNKSNTPESNAQAEGEPMEDVKPTLPSIITTHVGESRKHPLPDMKGKTEMKTAEGELPPILPQSPQSNFSNGHASTPITLPSISDQLGDINHLPEPAPANPAFSQSPPGRPGVPQFPAISGQGSPPKSPHDTFRPQMPSPGRGPPYFYNFNIRRPSQAEGGQYSSAEYSTPSTNNTDTPASSTDLSTPSAPVDRMSIDGITNPQIGGFPCTYPSCFAQPFQTQVSLLVFSRSLALI